MVSSHISVAGPAGFSVASGAGRNTFAPHAAGTTCPCAHVWPRVLTAPLIAQPFTVCKLKQAHSCEPY